MGRERSGAILRMLVSLRRVLRGNRSTDESADRARVGEARFDQSVRELAAYLRRIAGGGESTPVAVPRDVLRVLPSLAPVLSESVHGEQALVALSPELSEQERRRVLNYAGQFLHEPGPPDFPFLPQMKPPFDLSLLLTHPEEGNRRLQTWLEEVDAEFRSLQSKKRDFDN